MSKVSASKKIPLMHTAHQQRSVIFANTEMKKKLDTDNEGMIPDYESEPGMSEEYVLKYLSSIVGSNQIPLWVGAGVGRFVSAW